MGGRKNNWLVSIIHTDWSLRFMVGLSIEGLIMLLPAEEIFRGTYIYRKLTPCILIFSLAISVNFKLIHLTLPLNPQLPFAL